MNVPAFCFKFVSYLAPYTFGEGNITDESKKDVRRQRKLRRVLGVVATSLGHPVVKNFPDSSLLADAILVAADLRLRRARGLRFGRGSSHRLFSTSSP